MQSCCLIFLTFLALNGLFTKADQALSTDLEVPPADVLELTPESFDKYQKEGKIMILFMDVRMNFVPQAEWKAFVDSAKHLAQINSLAGHISCGTYPSFRECGRLKNPLRTHEISFHLNGNFVKEFKGQRDSVKQIRDFSIVVQKKLGILAKEEMCGAPDEEQAQIQYEQERKQAHSVKDGEGMIL